MSNIKILKVQVKNDFEFRMNKRIYKIITKTESEFWWEISIIKLSYLIILWIKKKLCKMKLTGGWKYQWFFCKFLVQHLVSYSLTIQRIDSDAKSCDDFSFYNISMIIILIILINTGIQRDFTRILFLFLTIEMSIMQKFKRNFKIL